MQGKGKDWVNRQEMTGKGLPGEFVGIEVLLLIVTPGLTRDDGIRVMKLSSR